MLPTTKIEDLLYVDRSKNVSLVAVVYDVAEPQTYACKDSITRTTQEVVLVDDSNKAVTLTLWANHINKLDDAEGTAVVVENVCPREYRGRRTVSTTSTTAIKRFDGNPTPEQQILQEWWSNSSDEARFKDLDLPEEE